MLSETPRGGADSRTRIGVSRERTLSMTWSSAAPSTSPSTTEDRGHRPIPHRATARSQTGLIAETRVLGSASRRPPLTVMKGACRVTRP